MKTGIIPMTQSGAILGRPGQYKSPPFLFTSKGERGSVTLYDFVRKKPVIPDNPSEIPEDFGKDSLVIVPYVVKPFVFYCDSIEWDGNIDNMDKSGDGTKENPWRNVNYALYRLQCIIDTCCDYIQLKVSGIVNYLIYPNMFFRPAYIYGRNRLIISGINFNLTFTREMCDLFSWLISGIEKTYFIDFNAEIVLANDDFNGFGGNYLYFYNSKIKITDAYTGDDNRNISVFNVYYSNFYDCNVDVITAEEVNGGYYIYIFNSNLYSNFYHCKIKLTSGRAFHNCHHSYFYDIQVAFEENYSVTEVPNRYCFNNNYDSVFYKCQCIGNSLIHRDPGWGSGATYNIASFFVYNYRSAFINCAIDHKALNNDYITTQVRASATLFSENDNSCFYNCEAELEATVYGTDGTYIDLNGYGNRGAQYYSCRCTLNANTKSVMPVDRYYSTTANSRATGYGFISQGENTVYHNCNASISCVSYISYMANDTYGPYQACDADSIAYGFQYSPKSGDVISGCNATLSVSATAEYSRYVEGKATEEKCELYNMDNGECEGES